MNEIIIIGSGPAGLTAAVYSARANLNPIVFAGSKFGGQLMTTTEVENFPGFPNGVTGPELMQNMIKQAKRFGADIRFQDVSKVELCTNSNKIYVGENLFESKSVIIATGASSRLLNIPGEQEFWGKGVSTCATCDGAFYRNKVVAVVGGGDSAMEEALFLTRFATKVYLIHRKGEFRASRIMQKRVMEHEKIKIIWNTTVDEIQGELTVKKLKLTNIVDQKTTEIETDGIFIAIGHIPNVEFLNSQIELDNLGYIKAQNHTHTNIEGVFVAGDVHDHHYRQAITAAGMGCMAAIDAERWLAAQNLEFRI